MLMAQERRCTSIVGIMQLGDPQATSTAYLILRHLYDGDIIEWPVPEDHPQRAIFEALEAQGYIARWDRIWPLRDRYRLTEQGIAQIEAVYRPAGAEAFFHELRGQNLSPEQRRAYFASRRLDPVLWPLLHDPSTHWSTYATQGSRYQAYVWEDQRPPRKRRPRPGAKPMKMARPAPPPRPVIHHAPPRRHVVDLDREVDPVAPRAPDYDVS
jgi:hypothetical protein